MTKLSQAELLNHRLTLIDRHFDEGVRAAIKAISLHVTAVESERDEAMAAFKMAMEKLGERK